MTSIHNNIPVNILSTTIDTRAHITTTHAIRTMDIGYSVSQQDSLPPSCRPTLSVDFNLCRLYLLTITMPCSLLRTLSSLLSFLLCTTSPVLVAAYPFSAYPFLVSELTIVSINSSDCTNVLSMALNCSLPAALLITVAGVSLLAPVGPSVPIRTLCTCSRVTEEVRGRQDSEEASHALRPSCIHCRPLSVAGACFVRPLRVLCLPVLLSEEVHEWSHHLRFLLFL